MRRVLLPALVALLSVVSALFEDQAGKIDWARENIGGVTHALFQVHGASRLVYGMIQAMLLGNLGGRARGARPPFGYDPVAAAAAPWRVCMRARLSPRPRPLSRRCAPRPTHRGHRSLVERQG